MSVGGGVAPAVLETLEFPAALERVAAHAVGPLGAASVRQRVPAVDPETIRTALAQVAELAALVLRDDAIRAEAVPDITSALDLLGVPGSALEGPALASVGQALAAARVTAADLARLATDAPRTAALRVDPPPRELERRLGESLDPTGQVLDGASRDLARARRAVREARERLFRKLEAMLAGLDPADRAPDAAVTIRGGRYVIPIRTTARARVGGIVHDESATRATVFVEPPEVIELGNELRAAEAQEQREILRVLRELTEALRPYAHVIAAAWEMCIAFDDLCARARYAVEVNGFAPAIATGPLEIHAGRHPLLGNDAVPFDLVLAPDEFTVLVSGPNTGGKTVLIKAVGLLCLMAQSGIIPPIGPQSMLPVFTGVFADIGDRQSIAASLSTFSAHLAQLRDILEHAAAGSLVLLDEIGSGTDPAEGGALAAAVLKTLTRRRALTLATTHLGALKQLAAQTVGIVNASLQFDAETLTPTYRLLKGVPGRSYGLAIARRLGLAGDVLDLAERAVPDAERALDALLATVEARARELEARERDLATRMERLDEDVRRVDTRAEDIAQREREVAARARSLERAAREQTRAYLLEARRKVEAALGQARAAVDEATAKEARRLLEKAIEDTDRERAGEGEKPGEGWVSLDELRRQRQEASGAPRRPPSPARPPAGAGRAAPTVAASEVSLIGLRVADAEPLLTKALDDAILADLPYLRVIHGKGTGALRQLVHDVLAADKRVKRFGFAPANQGGHGVTVAEFTP
jgi:DNA mismatch repair protein MutS2